MPKAFTKSAFSHEDDWREANGKTNLITFTVLIWGNSFFLQNSITVSTVFEFLSNNLPRVRFCLVILQNNLADVFQRFPSNANADLNLSFFIIIILYCIILFIYLFFLCIYRLPLFQLSPQTINVFAWSFYFQFSKGRMPQDP